MRESKKCYVVVDGYCGNDDYIDGNIRVFSTREKAVEFIEKSKTEMKKDKRPGDKFHDYYDNQTIAEFEMK